MISPRIIGIVVLLVGLVILPHFLKFHHQDFLIFLGINILVVVSYRLMTLTGEWSLIHIVMMGVGAYTSALLSKSLGVSFWISMPMAGISAGFVAALLCFPLFRTTNGDHLLFTATHRACLLVFAFSKHWKMTVYAFKVSLDRRFVTACKCTELQIFEHGKTFKHPPPFRNVGDAHPQYFVGRQLIDTLAIEINISRAWLC